MPNLSAHSNDPKGSALARARGASKGLALGALALALAACPQSSTPSVSPDTAGSGTDSNAPSGGKTPDATTGAPTASGTPTGTATGAPPATPPTTAGTPPTAPSATDAPPADAPPAGSGAGGERRAHPEFVQKMIARFQGGPPENPPRTVTRYDYKGQTVYYVSAPCCDFQTELYDTQGKLICAPDGGITGRGDGKCPDFNRVKKDPLVVWQDTRKPGGKPPGKTGPSPKGTATATPPTIPTKPAATQ